MKNFLKKHRKFVTDTLSCFDRIMFKGYLPLARPEAMERLIAREGLLNKDFKRFISNQSERVKEHAKRMAERAGRPVVRGDPTWRTRDHGLPQRGYPRPIVWRTAPRPTSSPSHRSGVTDSQAASCPRSDRQDSSISPMAGPCPRAKCHDHSPQISSRGIRQGARDDRGLIMHAKCKEVTR